MKPNRQNERQQDEALRNYVLRHSDWFVKDVTPPDREAFVASMRPALHAVDVVSEAHRARNKRGDQKRKLAYRAVAVAATLIVAFALVVGLVPPLRANFGMMLVNTQKVTYDPEAGLLRFASEEAKLIDQKLSDIYSAEMYQWNGFNISVVRQANLESSITSGEFLEMRQVHLRTIDASALLTRDVGSTVAGFDYGGRGYVISTDCTDMDAFVELLQTLQPQ